MVGKDAEFEPVERHLLDQDRQITRNAQNSCSLTMNAEERV